jgi:hypothetical protein
MVLHCKFWPEASNCFSHESIETYKSNNLVITFMDCNYGTVMLTYSRPCCIKIFGFKKPFRISRLVVGKHFCDATVHSQRNLNCNSLFLLCVSVYVCSTNISFPCHLNRNGAQTFIKLLDRLVTSSHKRHNT